jgi:hypothetical protein
MIVVINNFTEICLLILILKEFQKCYCYTGVPELAPQRKQTNADDNLDSKNANEEQLMACIKEL